MTAHRLGLVGSGIDMSLAPAFHVLAGKLVGIEVSYELIPRRPDPRRRVRRLHAPAGRRRLPRRQRHRAVQGDRRARRRPTVHRGRGHRCGQHPAPGARRPDARATTPTCPASRGPTAAASDTSHRAPWPCWAPAASAAPPPRHSSTSAPPSLRIYDVVPDRSHTLAGAAPPAGSRRAGRRGLVGRGAVDGVDGLVNGTPVGMSWSPGTPVDLRAVDAQRWVFDAVYSPIETPLMVRATAVGLDRITGFDLFLGQAIDAFEIFTGHDLGATVPDRAGDQPRHPRTRARRVSPMPGLPAGTATATSSSSADAGPRRTSVGRRVGQAPPATLRRCRRAARADRRPHALPARPRAGRGRSSVRREAQVVAHLLAHDVSLVILAPGATPACDQRLLGAARPVGGRAVAARTRKVEPAPDRLSGDCRDIADHVVDLEPFHADVDEPGRAVARHILQLFVTGELRGSIRLPDDVQALSADPLCDDVAEAMTRWEDELPARSRTSRTSPISIIDVEPFQGRRRRPGSERSPATSPVCSQPTILTPGPPAEPREVVRHVPRARSARRGTSASMPELPRDAGCRRRVSGNSRLEYCRPP